MASPDGTLSNMFPPMCSTPVKHLEISGNEWIAEALLECEDHNLVDVPTRWREVRTSWSRNT
jgi:hypothetical protein